MFVRQKKNKSGSTTIAVIDKSRGGFKTLKTIGTSSDAAVIKELLMSGSEYAKSYGGQLDLFSNSEEGRLEQETTERVLANIESILLNGAQLVLGHAFRRIGFDAIDDDILKDLVIARLCQPLSKSATVDYLKSYFDEDVELHSIYRYLDKLHNTQQEKIQQISVEHTRKILGGKIGLAFYDVTTLYFESDAGDDFRAPGFSKDGKHSQPQVVLGLLVSAGGYPLAYSLFNGSQYEGYTMIPVVDDFVKRFDLKDFVIVADSGLMSRKNIALLESGGYKYIVGARIKNENAEIKSWILSLKKCDGFFHEIAKPDKCRLIVGYSEKRAKKDAHNREKGVRRLAKAYGSGRITKDNINKRGYNKFLEISDNVEVNISRQKIMEDEQWDGWKGYITNTDLAAEETYRQYSELWVVEKAYRVTKGTLELRPMFHFTQKRIEAHVCICFVAYKVYKEMERVLKQSDISLSVDKILNIAKTITTIRIKLPKSNRCLSKTMVITKRHKLIEPMLQAEFWQK
jgi:transposase